jgi:hypothetical protein
MATISMIKKNVGLILSVSMLLELKLISTQAPTKIMLDSKILEMFDGVPFALDGDAFDDMLHVRKALHNMLIGKKNPQTDAMEGVYTYQNRLYSINELAVIESAGESGQAFKDLLLTAKNDLATIAEPFMQRARGTKHFLLPILTDWSKKRTREASLLLKWHHEEEGKELEIFRQDITSFNKLKGFCDDLVLFMEDLMYNCPKGFNQLLKKKRAGKAAS